METLPNGSKKCSVCTEIIKDARILPGCHRFCLECFKKRFEVDILKVLKNQLDCLQCDLTLDVPGEGLEKLKEDEFNAAPATTTGGNNNPLCGACLEGNCEKFCVICETNLSSSFLSIHKQFALTKDRTCVDFETGKSKLEETKFCNSCKKLVCDDDFSNHEFCELIDINNCFLNFQKKLTQKLAAVENRLSCFELETSAAAMNVDYLKVEIKEQSDKLKRYVDTCVDELNEDADEEYERIRKALHSVKLKLLSRKMKLEKQIRYCQDTNRCFGESTSQETETKFLQFREKMELESDDYDKNQNDFSTSLFDKKFKLSFKTAINSEKDLRCNNIVGSLRHGNLTTPELIKNIKDAGIIDSCSLGKTNYYGLTSGEMNGFLEGKITTFNHRTLACLSSTVIKTTDSYQFLRSSILVAEFWCVLLGHDNLRIYNLLKQPDCADWKREITLSFVGHRLFKSSDDAIFIESDLKIVEMTVDGDVIQEITLPYGIEGISSIVHLAGNYYATIWKNIPYKINNKGENIRRFYSNSSKFLPKLPCLYQMVTDCSSNIFVYNQEIQNIFVLDYNLNLIRQFDAHCKPRHICYGQKRNRLLVFGDDQLIVFQL